jgi:flagellar motor switch/type III secretory pathway protein FliN
MRVELAQTDIDHEGLIEHAQRGAVLLTETPLGSRVSLIVSGEHVASATLGVINGSFALRVLPK